MDDKRKFVRFNAPLYVKYHLNDELRQAQAVAQNVSMGGAALALDKEVKIKANSTLQLYFLLPEKTLAVSGKVTWVKDSELSREVGISFTELPDACREELYRHIFKHHRHEIVDKWWQG